MRLLQPIINVSEIPPAVSRLRQRLPSLRELTSPSPDPHEEAVLKYLEQGVICGIYNDRSMLYDVLQPLQRKEITYRSEASPGIRSIQPNVIMTDGIWLWPGALLYYVKEYHLHLPPSFLQHAEQHQWRLDPASVPTDELNWDTFDAVPVPA